MFAKRLYLFCFFVGVCNSFASQHPTQEDPLIIPMENLGPNYYGSTDLFQEIKQNENTRNEQGLEKKSIFSRVAPTLTPALTGCGAMIYIAISFYDLYTEGYTHRHMIELTSHLFWFSSAALGVSYNLWNTLK